VTRYLVVYEHDEHGWGAYSPDLEGCVAVGDTRQEVEQLMAEAIPFHIEGMRDAGLEIPKPGNNYGYVAA
jgi:predicted RNase H-like HicB family nuclease